LAAVLHINESNAAGNSKRLYTPGLLGRSELLAVAVLQSLLCIKSKL